jgi:hypothetical protein
VRTNRRRVRHHGGQRAIHALPWVAPMRPRRLAGHQQPPAEIPRLHPLRPIPPDPDRPQEAEPPKQVHAVGAHRRRRPPGGLRIPEELRTGSTGTPVGSSSRHGIHGSLVCSTRPTCDTLNPANPSTVTSSSITVHDARPPTPTRHSPAQTRVVVQSRGNTAISLLRLGGWTNIAVGTRHHTTHPPLPTLTC